MRPDDLDVLQAKLLSVLPDAEDKQNIRRVIKVVSLAILCPMTHDAAVAFLSGDLDIAGFVNREMN